ncbi:protein kinase domain-containing protein [Chondromyces crocatus]|uniref:Protein kinase n=1 Tax=Chondromyces crocatus TaxID=52 RepID=A0A0K1E745_CHOCO|nr:protein kinase [Chondromyces crocatus]AKT36685.1 protein kinase [Chondromyces crocatus]
MQEKARSPSGDNGIESVRCRACGRRTMAKRGCVEHGHREKELVAAAPDPLYSAASRCEGELPSFGGYRLQQRLGGGGFGVVFAATPVDGGAEVAIKIARKDRPEASRRLVKEAAILADIGPPYAPQVHARGRLPEGMPYVVMESIRCPTLADRLVAAGGTVHFREAACLVDAALQTLEVVHARGYVHRDLKPENIFIIESQERLRATIVDYGLATTEEPCARTSEGAALGTPEYMAPEQCEGRPDIDGRADLYAVGVIFYELLAGRPPFWGPPAAVREDQRSRRPARLRPGVKLPIALEEVVLRALAKDRRERPASASEFRMALARALRVDEETQDAPTPESERSAAPSSGPTSAPRLERRTVGVLFLETELDLASLQRRMASLGGDIAHSSSGHVVAVFDHEPNSSPTRRALRAARELIRRNVCQRALLDLASVVVQRRPKGVRRYISPLFTNPRMRLPEIARATGKGNLLFVTPDAAAALPDTPAGGVNDDEKHLSIRPHQTSSEACSDGGAEPIPVPLDEEKASDFLDEPLLGREAVVRALLESARAAASLGLPTIVQVTGEAGLGKSHLASFVAQQLSQLMIDAQVLELQAREPLVGGTDPTLRALLQFVLELPAHAPSDGGRALISARLEGDAIEHLAVARALGWLDGSGTMGSAHDDGAYPELRALEAAPGALRAAVSMVAGSALRRRTSRGPVFVILDDAHLADDAALSALEYAAQAAAKTPLWICALARPGFEQARPNWGRGAACSQVNQLGPLDRAGAVALCRRLLAPVEDVPEPALDLLIARTKGAPLLLSELVLGLKREGIVRLHPRGGGWYVATDELDRLPDAPLIEWLARAELDALPQALQEFARLISLLGHEMMLDDIVGVLERLDGCGQGEPFPLDPRVATSRLMAAGVLAQDRRSGRIGFRHPLVRDAIAKSIDPSVARHIHLAALAHHQATAPEADRSLRARAHHAAAAGLRSLASNAFMRLADQARDRHAYVEAEALYTRSLEQTEPCEIDESSVRGSPTDKSFGAANERAAAQRRRGLMRCRLGRNHDALEDLRTAREAAETIGDTIEQMEILLDEATTLDWMEEYRSSEARVNEARRRGETLPSMPAPLASRLLLGIGRSFHRFSREAEAAAMLEAAVTQSSDLGEEGYETLVVSLLMLGFIYQGLARLDDAREVLDRAVMLCEVHRDMLHLAPAINNRALLRACRGDKEGMIHDLSRVLSIAREYGQGALELVGEYNLGECLYLMDDMQAAALHVARAAEIERRRSGGRARPIVMLLDARVLLGGGDEGKARVIFEKILAHQEAARELGRMDALLLPSEEVLLDMIDLATRTPDAAAWDELHARSERLSVGQEQVEVLEARAIAALRHGRLDLALDAHMIACAAAARIPNAMRLQLQRHGSEIRRAFRTGPFPSTP